jgi:hypothetical protein
MPVAVTSIKISWGAGVDGAGTSRNSTPVPECVF